MNSLTVKILTGLLSVLIITTIGSQIYSALTERHDTEEAVLVTINEDIAFKGVIIRDEKVSPMTAAEFWIIPIPTAVKYLLAIP